MLPVLPPAGAADASWAAFISAPGCSPLIHNSLQLSTLLLHFWLCPLKSHFLFRKGNWPSVNGKGLELYKISILFYACKKLEAPLILNFQNQFSGVFVGTNHLKARSLTLRHQGQFWKACEDLRCQFPINSLSPLFSWQKVLVSTVLSLSEIWIKGTKVTLLI